MERGRESLVAQPLPPTLSTPLIGRAAEVGAVGELLCRADVRLATLCGAGGIGKTRIALAAAATLADRYSGGVHVVDLAPLSDPATVVPTIATRLGVRDAGDQPILDALGATIGERRMLLVLDNFEHVLEAATDVARLLDNCPNLTLLTTSRSLLRVYGECPVSVPPLALPVAAVNGSPTELQACASVELFVQRARAARADFSLSDDNLAAVAEICRHLDGMPLAIELAAARVKILSAQQVADRLGDCLRLLSNGPHSAPRRQQTLRATLDWSYDLLPPAQQMLLRQLSVFAAGSSLAGVEAVCDVGGDDLLDCLSGLVDHSLVLVAEQAGVARYRLLEPVRQYGLERLRESPEVERATRTRHAAWSVDFAERAEPELRGPTQVRAMAEVAGEHDNLRGAIRWAIEHGDAVTSLRIGAALWKFWEVRGHIGEGRALLQAALCLDDAATLPRVRARALYAAGILAQVAGDLDGARALHEAALDLRRVADDQLGVAQSLLGLCSVLRNRGDAQSAVDLLNESVLLFRRLGERRFTAMALNTLGLAHLDLRAYAPARAALEESKALFEQVDGPRAVAIALGNLADVARAQGDLSSARRMLLEALDQFRDLQDPTGSAVWLESLALVAAANGDAEPAAVLFGAAAGVRAGVGVSLPPADLPAHDRAMAGLVEKLGTTHCSAAVERGRVLSLDEAVAFAHAPLHEVSRTAELPLILVPPVRAAASPLTSREEEVASLIARGLTNKQIADALIITKQTADKHVGNILGKLGVASRSQVAVWVVSKSAAAAPAGAAA